MSAPETILRAGTPASGFPLHATPDQQLALSELHDIAHKAGAGRWR